MDHLSTHNPTHLAVIQSVVGCLFGKMIIDNLSFNNLISNYLFEWFVKCSKEGTDPRIAFRLNSLLATLPLNETQFEVFVRRLQQIIAVPNQRKQFNLIVSKLISFVNMSEGQTVFQEFELKCRTDAN